MTADQEAAGAPRQVRQPATRGPHSTLPPGADVLCTTRGDGGLRVHIRGTGWDHLRLLVSPDPADCALLYRRTGPLAYCEPATADVVRSRSRGLTNGSS